MVRKKRFKGKSNPPVTPGPSSHNVVAVQSNIMFPDLFTNVYSSSECSLDLNQRKKVYNKLIHSIRKLSVGELETVSIKSVESKLISGNIEWTSTGAPIPRGTGSELEIIYNYRPVEFWVRDRRTSYNIVVDWIYGLIKMLGPVFILWSCASILQGNYSKLSTLIIWTWNMNVFWNENNRLR